MPRGAHRALFLGGGGTPLVGCCGDEKPFHPAVFQPPLCLCLITGPGAALRARGARTGS